MTHKTKGIVLRTIKYGDTSVIATIYTELFGIQSYLVKGVRQSTRKSGGNGVYFQPGGILNMVVYHKENAHLQFIKEYQWGFLYQTLMFDVVKNTVALYMIELLLHSLKQPEANPELFDLAFDTLVFLDSAHESQVANLPIFFTFALANLLGFKIQGQYSNDTPVCDMYEGEFVANVPHHPYYVEGELAEATAWFLQQNNMQQLHEGSFRKTVRRQLLAALQIYLCLHVSDFGETRSLAILQDILS